MTDNTNDDSGAPAPFEVAYARENETSVSTLLTEGLVPFVKVAATYTYQRPKRGPYHIAITEADEYLVLIMPFDGDKPGSAFMHPAIARTRNTTLEYKHYHKDGGKSWTSKPGVEHVLVIPRAEVQIKIDPNDPGMSYVPVVINGVEVTLNVSGGTGGGGWTDWVGTVASACSNVPLKTLKALAAVAVRGTAHEPFLFWDEQEKVEKEKVVAA